MQAPAEFLENPLILLTLFGILAKSAVLLLAGRVCQPSAVCDPGGPPIPSRFEYVHILRFLLGWFVTTVSFCRASFFRT